jgi:hypothetical protein
VEGDRLCDVECQLQSFGLTAGKIFVFHEVDHFNKEGTKLLAWASHYEKVCPDRMLQFSNLG